MLWGREASALKCYQFSLALQSGHNHTSYYSYNYKIAFTVFFKENSKLSFEERGFSKAAFQRTPTQDFPFDSFYREEGLISAPVQKIAKARKKSFQTVGGDTIFAIWPKPNVNFKDLLCLRNQTKS